MVVLGQLKRVDPRQVWSHEASHFTPWLAENLPLLGEALGLDLELKSAEAPVGDFSVDLLARDLNRDRFVVIENQLALTDHDHLGKLITYASGYDATTIIWIAPEIRDEHRQALDWLNQHSDTDTEFFGVVLELLQVDDSNPAVQFRPVAAPNNWQKRARESAAVPLTQREEAYRQFFQDLIDLLREKHGFTGARLAQPRAWYSFSSGVSGISFGACFGQGGKCRVELYIDPGDEVENKRVFDALLEARETLEARFGEALVWDRLDGKRTCRVAVYRPGRVDQFDVHEELRTWFADRLIRMKSVFGPEIRRIAG